MPKTHQNADDGPSEIMPSLVPAKVIHARMNAKFDVQKRLADLARSFDGIAADQRQDWADLQFKLWGYEGQGVTLIASVWGAHVGELVLAMLEKITKDHLGENRPRETEEQDDLRLAWGWLVHVIAKQFPQFVRHDWRSVMRAGNDTPGNVNERAELDAQVVRAIAQHCENKRAMGGVVAYLENLAEAGQGVEVPQLTDKQAAVLKTLANSKTLLVIVDVAAGAGFDRDTTGKYLAELEQMELVHRPQGERKGWGCTKKGREAVPALNLR